MEIPTNISRPNEFRWQFTIRVNGKRHTRGFSDKKYGGKDASLKAAIEYKKKFYEENNGVRGPIGPAPSSSTYDSA